MNIELTQNKTFVRTSSVHGLGVFAREDIAENAIIEECYSLLLPEKNNQTLNNYVFQYEDNYRILPLGCGCIFNHSNESNAFFAFDKERRIMTFLAKKPIKKGEEIFISYSAEWFADRGIPIKVHSAYRKYWKSFFGFRLRALLMTGGIFLLVHFSPDVAAILKTINIR